MGLNQRSIVTGGVFVAMAVLGFYSPDLRRHFPGILGQVLETAIFLGLIAVIGYAKLKKR